MIKQVYPRTIYTKRDKALLHSSLTHSLSKNSNENNLYREQYSEYPPSISANTINNVEVINEYNKNCKNIIPELYMVPSGIHGVCHAKRVLFLCLTLSSRIQLGKAGRNILVEAAKFHDIGRFNDEDCEIHGCLSFKRMLDLKLANCMDTEDLQVLKYVIENHCIEDEIALKRLIGYRIREKEKACRLLKIFKDADALDRVRTNDLEVSYLRHDESKKLLDLSWHLLHQLH
ncbi:MAG: hypothetical protein N2484_04880 [Clostridia bacterium]|nr:hypothetical protein [Clostridia bacterium]